MPTASPYAFFASPLNFGKEGRKEKEKAKHVFVGKRLPQETCYFSLSLSLSLFVSCQEDFFLPFFPKKKKKSLTDVNLRSEKGAGQKKPILQFEEEDNEEGRRGEREQ